METKKVRKFVGISDRKKGESSSTGEDGRDIQQNINPKRCVRVLLVGHAGAGKSEVLSKIQELGGLTKDDSHMAQIMDVNEEEHDKGETVEFQEAHFETEKSRYHFLEAPSHHRYVPKMISRALQADIAVFLVSDSQEALVEQTKCCADLITTLCIPHVLLVLNKMDNHDWSRERFTSLLQSTALALDESFIKEKVKKYLPVSARSGLNIQTKMSEVICNWYKGSCLFTFLDEIEVLAQDHRQPLRSDNKESRFIEELVMADLALDEDPTNGALWFRRAKVLEKLEKFTDAFEAAEKAFHYGLLKHKSSKKEKHCLLHKIKGDNHRAHRQYTEALQEYCQAQNLYKRKECTEAVHILEGVIDATNKECDQHKKNKTEEKKRKQKMKEEEKGKIEKMEEEEESKTRDDALDEKDDKVHDTIKYDAPNACDSPSSKKINVVGVSDYVLEPQGENVYTGHKKTSFGIDFPVSLIRSQESQNQNFKALLSLDHSNILSISDILTNVTIDDVSSPFLVVESVQSVDHYYSVLLETFRHQCSLYIDDKEKILSQWWSLIGPQFKKIFRGVVDGLIFLLSRGHTCRYDSFVTHNGIAKILPSMDPGYKVGDVVENLVKQMKSIVYLPCLGHNLEPRWLPNDLRHLFIFMTKDKLKHVPVWWLLDHHFFWKSEEAIDFIFNLRRLYGRHGLVRFREFLNIELLNGYEKFWSHYIPKGIFEAIWKKGDPNLENLGGSVEVNELKSRGWFKVAPYCYDVDIVRYMAAVYTHYNDAEYDEFATEYHDLVLIEQQLRSFFPNIYGFLVNAIYYCVQEDGNFDSSPPENPKILKKLSRRRDY